MTPERQRIAIAEACGWTLPINQNYYALPLHIQGHAGKKDGINLGQWTELPDYLNDLNAMHEAEKMLTDSNGFQCQRYCQELRSAHLRTRGLWPSRFGEIHSPAAQRAEAFLKTIWKWED